jgi:hypothetical protein
MDAFSDLDSSTNCDSCHIRNEWISTSYISDFDYLDMNTTWFIECLNCYIILFYPITCLLFSLYIYHISSRLGSRIDMVISLRSILLEFHLSFMYI